MAEAEAGFTNPIRVGAKKSSVCTYEEQVPLLLVGANTWLSTSVFTWPFAEVFWCSTQHAGLQNSVPVGAGTSTSVGK